MKLEKTCTLKLETEKPFNFRFTVWKPSHFVSPLEIFDKNRDVCYRTFIINGKPIGIKLSKSGWTGIKAEVYSKKTLTKEQKAALTEKLRWSYGLDEELNQFDKLARKDKLLKPTLKLLKGTRNSCPHTIFEILCISLVLQNTNVKRSQNMLNALLNNYGTKIKFSGREMYSFFTPEKINKISEEELREKCRLGYRAKFLKSIAENFSNPDIESKVKTLSYEEAREYLMKIKGIGPYSATIAIVEYLRFPNYMVLDIWSNKVFSKLFFKHENSNPDRIQKEASRRWGEYKGLAASYLMEYLYYKEKVNSRGNVK